MEAKDTVMNIFQVREAIKDWERLPDDNHINFDDYLTQRQAEISFKAGKREVVELVHSNGTVSRDRKLLSISYPEWQAQLKVWGVK